jgi:hypothetical protein
MLNTSRMEQKQHNLDEQNKIREIYDASYLKEYTHY